MPTIDRQLATLLLQDLVRIPSVNPSLVSGAPGEGEVAAYIADTLTSWNLDVRVWEVAPGRPNVVGLLKGAGRGRSLLFNAHMDTVSVDGMADPYAATLADGKVYGRGAVDMKGSIAATLAAAKALIDRDARPAGDVLFTYVADEEHASLGSEGILTAIREGRLPAPAAAINVEPTGAAVGLGHKGFTWMRIDVMGRAAHGSRPDLGVDAIVQMGRVLCAIGDLAEELRRRRPHPLLGTGSLHASIIEGGRELSSYPDRCTLKLERRTVPPESADTVEAEIQEILTRLSHRDRGFRATSELGLVRRPWEADPASDVVRALTASISRVTGRQARTMVQTGWLDAALFGHAGIPTVVYGPTGEGLHALVEWVALDSVFECAAVYVDLIESFCG